MTQSALATYVLIARLELSFTLICCAYGLLKGGYAERLGAGLILGFYLADDIALKLWAPHFPVLAIFVGDFALALSLLIVAVRFGSIWLGFAMLLQSANLCSQGLALSGDGLSNFQQLTLNNMLSLLMLLCIAIGTTISWIGRGKPKPKSPSQPFHLRPPGTLA